MPYYAGSLHMIHATTARVYIYRTQSDIIEASAPMQWAVWMERSTAYLFRYTVKMGNIFRIIWACSLLSRQRPFVV